MRNTVYELRDLVLIKISHMELGRENSEVFVFRLKYHQIKVVRSSSVNMICLGVNAEIIHSLCGYLLPHDNGLQRIVVLFVF